MGDDATAPGAHGETLRVHGFLPASRANGPGLRAVLWVQGCTLGCPGCFNPPTHPRDGGEAVATADLAARIIALADRVEGLTVSGGEPLQQLDAVLDVLQRVRRATNLGVIVLTGYTWAEVQAMPRAVALLGCVDALVTGRYVEAQRLAHGLRGSANKQIHRLTDRYGPAELEDHADAEVLLGPDGEVTLSGIAPVRW